MLRLLLFIFYSIDFRYIISLLVDSEWFAADRSLIVTSISTKIFVLTEDWLNANSFDPRLNPIKTKKITFTSNYNKYNSILCITLDTSRIHRKFGVSVVNFYLFQLKKLNYY